MSQAMKKHWRFSGRRNDTCIFFYLKNPLISALTESSKVYQGQRRSCLKYNILDTYTLYFLIHMCHIFLCLHLWSHPAFVYTAGNQDKPQFNMAMEEILQRHHLSFCLREDLVIAHSRSQRRLEFTGEVSEEENFRSIPMFMTLFSIIQIKN